MIVNHVRNVCQALPKTVEYLLKLKPQNSRAGPVLVAPCPVMTVYEKPRERVLFSAVRDANPWFHAVEALWMLAGRDDAATLNKFVRNFGERFAEPDGRIHDAYGRRWRDGFGFDQLDAVVQRLWRNPEDRQCVVTMWDPRPNYFDDTNPNWGGRPCNTHVYLRIVDHLLDLTVCCRSNDMILGGHGANAVHFSVLQEYLAARIDVGVGRMYQLSNNCHVYLSELDRLYRTISQLGYGDLVAQLTDDRYTSSPLGSGPYLPLPMFDDPQSIDDDVNRFFKELDFGVEAHYLNTWFRTTLSPMMSMHNFLRQGEKREAHAASVLIASPDWQKACSEWLERRM